MKIFEEIISHVSEFKREAERVLSTHEKAPARIITVEQTKKNVTSLSIRQQILLEEAIACVENKLYRSAHVCAWAAFIDFIEEKISSDGLVKIHTAYPSWSGFLTIEDLKENIPEHQIIESAKKVGLINKAESKALIGLLSKRNECAHPTSYVPDLNESLGYISELLNRISKISSKPY